MFHIIKPSGRKLKFDIRIKMPDGQMVRFPGDRNRKVAEDRARKIEQLVNARIMDVPPSTGLTPWIEGLPQKFALRLIKCGLLDRRRIDQKLPIAEHCDQFQLELESRGVVQRYAEFSVNKLRRLFRVMKTVNYVDLTKERLLTALKDMKAETGWRKSQSLSKKTYREYIIIFKSFCKWMVATGRAMANPVADLKAPGAYVDPQRTRCPLSVEQFNKLFLCTNLAERSANQQAAWSGHDRALLYWVAAKTGFRLSEIRSFTRESVDLTTVPPTLTVKARNAKNRTKGVVPIPASLAEELRKRISKLSPSSPLFEMPNSWNVLKTFYRDLERAGIEKRLPTGEFIDFHTLRATAITWWLTEDRLSLKQVQLLARLKTLELVQKYTRGYQMTDCSFLERGPSFKFPDARDQDPDSQPGGVVAVPPAGPIGGFGHGAAQLPPTESFGQQGHAV
jgi:integrase